MTSTSCENKNCAGITYLSKYCGAYICEYCDQHTGLVRCYCGWSLTASNGREELEAMGETIDPED